MNIISLNNKSRKILQFVVITALLAFLLIWFVYINQKESTIQTQDTTIFIEDSNIHVFGDIYTLNFPNKVSMHYPYLLVVEPNFQKTHVYNLDQKKLENEFSQILLDYFNGQILINDGRSTFFNDKSLNTLCEKGFIKNESYVLCLTKVNPNTVENKLITIDPSTLKSNDIYVSKDIITDFSVINEVAYIGEINLHTKQNYLIINEDKIEIPSVVSLIYEMRGIPYFVTLKGELSSKNNLFDIDQKKAEDSQTKIYLYK